MKKAFKRVCFNGLFNIDTLIVAVQHFLPKRTASEADVIEYQARQVVDLSELMQTTEYRIANAYEKFNCLQRIVVEYAALFHPTN